MKKAVFAVMAAVVAMSFAVPAFADEAKKAEKPKTHQFTGEITAIDVAGKSVTLKNAKGETKSVVLGEKTKIATADNKAAELSNLKVGEKVTTKFIDDAGKNVAVSIAPPAPPKEKKPKNE